MMISTRMFAILLLCLLIPIGFLLAYRFGLPFLQPPRRDEIPSGAHIVPWITPTSSIASLSAMPRQAQPWNLTDVMHGSLRFDIAFNIALPNGTRSVPSTILLGHDGNLLYVGGIFRGIYSNPTSNSTVQFPNRFNLLLDADNDRILTYSESGSALFVAVGCPFFPSQCSLGRDGWGANALATGYGDMAWNEHVPLLGRSAWELAGDVCSRQGINQMPAAGDFTSEYDVKDGTAVIIFSRYLSFPGSCANDLQMKSGERWVMGFLFELGYSNKFSLYQDFMDGWPANVYPYTTNDASWWPKLAVDLANPPPQ